VRYRVSTVHGKPGKSWNLSAGHGNSWKSNMLSENKKAKRQKNRKKNDESETNRHKLAFYPL